LSNHYKLSPLEPLDFTILKILKNKKGDSNWIPFLNLMFP